MAKKTLREKYLDSADACVKAGRWLEACDHLEKVVAIQTKSVWRLYGDLARTLAQMGADAKTVC